MNCSILQWQDQRGFCRPVVGVASLFFEKWQKMKNFQVRMPIDWKLSNELSEL